jgi:hypothetical protein
MPHPGAAGKLYEPFLFKLEFALPLEGVAILSIHGQRKEQGEQENRAKHRKDHLHFSNSPPLMYQADRIMMLVLCFIDSFVGGHNSPWVL